MSLQGIPEDILRHVGLEPDGPRYSVTPLQRFSVEDAAPEFPTSALPKPVARLVEESAAAIGCPPDAIGLSALVALGSAIGNSRVIQPKKGWTESAAIYGAVIADSGEKKTAAIAATTDVVQNLENTLNREHDKSLEEFAREEREYEVERKEAAKQGLAAPPPPAVQPPNASTLTTPPSRPLSGYSKKTPGASCSSETSSLDGSRPWTNTRPVARARSGSTGSRRGLTGQCLLTARARVDLPASFGRS